MLFRVHRIRGTAREQFRWAAHTGGTATAKPKDYEQGEEVEGTTPYDVWKLLSARASLQPGDILEALDENDQSLWLKIYKYIGFEPVEWFVPEPKAEVVSHPEKEQK
jgi:hypothetical protein